MFPLRRRTTRGNAWLCGRLLGSVSLTRGRISTICPDPRFETDNMDTSDQPSTSFSIPMEEDRTELPSGLPEDEFLYADSTSESGGDYCSGDEDDAEVVENVLERAYTGALSHRCDPVDMDSALYYEKDFQEAIESSK